MSSRSERTRRAILNATWKLLKSRGAARIRMQDVAARASLSRQALYLHFPSRTALMLALVDHIGQELGGPLFGSVQKAPTARQALVTALHASALYEARIHDVTMALDIARHTDEAAAAAWRDRMALKRSAIRRLVSRLQRERALRPEWKPAMVTDAIWALTAPRTFDDLVVDRGWSLAQYERLLVACANVFLR